MYGSLYPSSGAKLPPASGSNYGGSYAATSPTRLDNQEEADRMLAQRLQEELNSRDRPAESVVSPTARTYAIS
jgi:hypothetical protein